MAISLSPKALAHASAKHPWRVIGAWAVVMVVSMVLIGTLHEKRHHDRSQDHQQR